MYLKMQVSLIASLSILLAASIATSRHIVFDVTKYGAKADGKTDISQAISDAWKKACASKSPSKIWIPKGTYMTGEVKLEGPCNSPIKFQMQGLLKAPIDPKSHGGLRDSWITFQYVNHLTLYGGGTFDGQGQIAWTQNNCGKNPNCKSLPVNLRFNFVNNARVVGLTSLNSKNFHVNVIGCKNLTFQRFTITAPDDSVNTDGIHIGRSNGINIINSIIGTGDDCISLGDGSKDIRVIGVTCGPGHGISVGSLGKYKNEEPVSGFYVRNCTLSGTDNGVRIKTWPALHGGTVTNMHFEDIIMDEVRNPIIIDQVYCPWNQCNKKAPSKVEISNVSFKNIRGTSTSPVAIQLSCSSGVPCKNVELSNIDLVYVGTEGVGRSECSNVKPKISGKLTPSGCN